MEPERLKEQGRKKIPVVPVPRSPLLFSGDPIIFSIDHATPFFLRVRGSCEMIIWRFNVMSQ